HRLTPTLYTRAGVEAVVAAARESEPVPVHLKVDTGMHRVGAPSAEGVELADAITARPELALEGVWTHLAVADEPDRPFTAEQLARFDKLLGELAARGIEPPIVHAANSAGAMVHPG